MEVISPRAKGKKKIQLPIIRPKPLVGFHFMLVVCFHFI
jgi:hypothetical protein